MNSDGPVPYTHLIAYSMSTPQAVVYQYKESNIKYISRFIRYYIGSGLEAVATLRRELGAIRPLFQGYQPVWTHNYGRSFIFILRPHVKPPPYTLPSLVVLVVISFSSASGLRGGRGFPTLDCEDSEIFKFPPGPFIKT